ncbi:MAG TPA: Kazal-type serine protease inhibitor, partial [archaeon]|nr:Kazal-type serine protease inhibitor [archaeon]
MNRKTGLLISIFIALALGLSTSAFAFSGTGYSIIYVQSCSSTDPSSCTSDATCQTAGNYWCGGSGGSGPCVSTSAMTSCPGASPSPRPSYSCPSPSSFACPPDTTSKLITPTSAGCPYYVCEAPSTSPTPTSVGSCTTSAPGYCTSQPTCETVGNYWCKSSVGGEYCVQSSSKTSCPGYTASPSPFYEPCNKGGPISSKCTCGPSGTLYTYGYCCGDVSSVGTWYAGSCETSTPSPTFSCTPSTPQHCSTIQACQGIGGKWNTATNQCEGSTSGSCSSNTPGYCITQPTCESAGNYWCKTIYGNPYCIQLSTKSACPESSVSPSPIPSTGPCVASTPWYCVTEPTCTGVGGYWNRNTGYCEAKYQSPYPSPTYSPKPEVCSKEQFWICKTESDCKAIGAFWNQGYCSDRPPACSAKEPWSCYDGASCKGAGANWCEYAPGKGTNFCSQYECPGQKCSVKEPWNCYDDSSCKAAGANWCKNQYGGTDWCQSYSCPIIVPTPKICPAIYSPPKICGPGEEYVPTFDNNGCSTGGNCIKRDTCPYEWKPVCGVDGKTYQNSCKAKTVGVGIDHDGECGYKLKCDDSFVEEHATKCTKYGGTPEKYTRPDGCTDIWCKNAKPQPTPTIDPRCKVVEDTLTGVKRFDCGGRVQECKTLSESERTYLKDKCYANG